MSIIWSLRITFVRIDLFCLYLTDTSATTFHIYWTLLLLLSFSSAQLLFHHSVNKPSQQNVYLPSRWCRVWALLRLCLGHSCRLSTLPCSLPLFASSAACAALVSPPRPAFIYGTSWSYSSLASDLVASYYFASTYQLDFCGQTRRVWNGFVGVGVWGSNGRSKIR